MKFTVTHCLFIFVFSNGKEFVLETEIMICFLPANVERQVSTCHKTNKIVLFLNRIIQ